MTMGAMSTISLAWPWCFMALPLPWLVRRWLGPGGAGAALRVPHLPPAVTTPSAPRDARFRSRSGSGSLPLWIATLAWVLLVCAAARPQAPAGFSMQAVSGRDLMLAFDVSGSMATADLRLDGKPAERLRVARKLADDFLRLRQGDRVGLIVFGSQAYLHTPLTFDLEAVRAALATMETGLAGRETALGDAIGLATKHLKPPAGTAASAATATTTTTATTGATIATAATRELIVLTDGANNTGTLAPQRAAWLAQRDGVRIHAIGIGAAPVGSGADALDESTLQQIARQSGGSYLRAGDSAGIENFFKGLDRIMPTAQGAASILPRRELYPWPLGVALALSAWLALRRARGAAA
jgi:Ca-activated chloride channel homolog